MGWCLPKFLSSFKPDIFTIALSFQARVILERTVTRTQVCNRLLMSSGHKIRNEIATSEISGKEEDEIFEPVIRIEHLTLGDSSDKDSTLPHE